MTDKQKMDKVLRDLESDKHVQQMKNYTQHGKVSTYEHCERVARLSFELNRKLHLHAKVPTLIKGAMLHDFYLYDWHHEDNGEHNLHGYRSAAHHLQPHVAAEPDAPAHEPRGLDRVSCGQIRVAEGDDPGALRYQEA